MRWVNVKTRSSTSNGNLRENDMVREQRLMGKDVCEHPTIFVVGSPRSGTSWLGNIFDSHPETLYLMEPDTVNRGDYPFTSDRIFREEAGRHIAELSRVRNLKVVGSRPIFPKDFRSWPLHKVRAGLLYGLKSAERILPRLSSASVGDFADVGNASLVIKSVSMLGRSASWAAASPSSKFVHLIRHPCGHTYSVLRGQISGKLEPRIALGFEECSVGQKYGIDRSALEKMPEALRIAWRWAILNEKAMEDLSGSLIISYEKLCEDSLHVCQALFQQVGLKWSAQTGSYLQESASRDGGYFETSRDPFVAANAWKGRLEESDLILEAISHTGAMDLFR